MKAVLLFPFKYFWGDAGFVVKVHLSLMLYMKSRGHEKIARYISNRLFKKQGVLISPHADINLSIKLVHPVGIVIGRGVKVEDNVTIYQSVTLGGARKGDGELNNFPYIGAGSVIFSGAAVLGGVKIGRRCVIGANSVVIQDVPDDCTAVGAPARIINRNTSV